MSGEYATVDLGSNSFHLLVVNRDEHGLQAAERMREKVQLMRGFANRRLDDAAMSRGRTALARFAQRLQRIPAERTTVVGTCALRQAENAEEFLEAARRILGCDVKIVTGETEAALIYRGVAYAIPVTGRRLVIDIGGGSTELASGVGSMPQRMRSALVGCVAYNDRFFSQESSFVAAYWAAKRAATDALTPLASDAMADGEVIGTSGTVESVLSVLKANGWAEETITPVGLGALEGALTDKRWLVHAGLPGLAPERVDIFPAGVAIVCAAFEVFGIQSMRYVNASLREGMLYDLLGLDPDPDPKRRSVLALARRCRVDEEHVARVRRTAFKLYEDVCRIRPWSADARELLEHATTLHEVGRIVGALRHHRHGAYLVQNAELNGFSAEEQRALVLLIRGHRRSFPELSFGAFDKRRAEELKLVCVILRLAAIIERGRSDVLSPEVEATLADGRLALTFPPGWLEANALSRRELEMEVEQAQRVKIELSFV